MVLSVTSVLICSEVSLCPVSSLHYKLTELVSFWSLSWKKCFWISPGGKYQINMSHLISHKPVYWIALVAVARHPSLLPTLMKSLFYRQKYKGCLTEKLTKKKKKKEGNARDPERISLSWNNFKRHCSVVHFQINWFRVSRTKYTIWHRNAWNSMKTQQKCAFWLLPTNMSSRGALQQKYNESHQGELQRYFKLSSSNV